MPHLQRHVRSAPLEDVRELRRIFDFFRVQSDPSSELLPPDLLSDALVQMPWA